MELALIAKAVVEKDSRLYGGRPLLFRGQNHEYLLGRKPAALDLLYEDPFALEPSLLPSQSRRVSGHNAVAAFNATLQSLLSSLVDLKAGEVRIWPTRFGDYVKTGIAQHYGLATPALDLTTDLSTAVWFALNQLGHGKGQKLETTSVPDEQLSVIYFFVPNTRNFQTIEVGGSMKMRQVAQHGWLHTSGWGLRQNRIAESLMLAVYLPGALAASLSGHLPTSEDLFLTNKSMPQSQFSGGKEKLPKIFHHL
ncbi:FRG domain-containing protein [Arthrobacter alpinus]|nr:FRG domain-containing protein [Arthrobacter alpinus]